MEAKSIGQILDHIQSSFDKNKISSFGLWFRGQEDISFNLEPSIFRQGSSFGNIKYNEMAMYREFLLLNECQAYGNKSVFEWLTLMQHYSLPTRLLDWSSNLLIALYFGIKNDTKDGALFVLDPLSFNGYSDPKSGSKMFDRLNTQVIIRANLSIIEEVKALSNQVEIKNILKEKTKKLNTYFNTESGKIELDNLWWQSTIQTPVAVLPPQQNSRILVQQGKFTIHGGKIVNGIKIVDNISIEDIADNSLLKIKIPSSSKEYIMEELNYCGINEATIFPELEYQAKNIKKTWTLHS